MNVGITHELSPGFSLAAEYYRIDFKNITMRTNSLLDADSYNQFERRQPARRRVDPGLGDQAGVPRPGRQRRQHQRRHEAQLQRPRHQLQRAHAARRPRLRRLQPRALASTTSACRPPATRTVRSTATSRRAASRGRSSSRPRWSTRCRSGASRSARSLQSLNGYLVGTAAQAYGGFTAGTGFDRPNGQGTFWQLTLDHPLRRQLHGPVHAGRAGAADWPPVGVANINVPLVAPETEFTPRINQVDFSVSKTVQFGALPHDAEDRPLQRAQLGRLLVGGDGAVRRARPTCSRRSSCRAASSASAST